MTWSKGQHKGTTGTPPLTRHTEARGRRAPPASPWWCELLVCSNLLPSTELEVRAPRSAWAAASSQRGQLLPRPRPRRLRGCWAPREGFCACTRLCGPGTVWGRGGAGRGGWLRSVTRCPFAQVWAPLKAQGLRTHIRALIPHPTQALPLACHPQGERSQADLPVEIADKARPAGGSHGWCFQTGEASRALLPALPPLWYPRESTSPHPLPSHCLSLFCTSPSPPLPPQ